MGVSHVKRPSTFVFAYLAGCLGAVSQSPTPAPAAPPEFEVASVKQLDQSLLPGQPDLSFVGTSGKPFKISGNRVTVRGTLRGLIADAFDIQDYQISATPSWTGSLMFTITAEAPAGAVPTQDQVRPMLQSLLADRCRLKFHRETRDLPVYHLTVVKPSRFLTPAASDESFSWKLTMADGGMLRSKATKESIGDFVRLVGVSANRPVIDKTGLTGDIDYDILIAPPEGKTPDDVNRAIIDAVIDQLGLKLVTAKDSVEVLVVDGIEKPSAN